MSVVDVAECWNGWCIGTDCDGERHHDVTGYSWRQKQGDEYCPVCSAYHVPVRCEGDLCESCCACADKDHQPVCRCPGVCPIPEHSEV